MGKIFKKSSEPTQRQLRVGEEIRHALSSIIGKGSFLDPVLESISVTITEVRISPDLRKAKVFVVPMKYGKQTDVDDKADDTKFVLSSLTENQKQIRFELGRSIHLKFTPELRFFEDEGFSYAAKIDNLLRDPKVKKDIETTD